MTIKEQNDIRFLKSAQEIWALAQEILLKRLKIPTFNSWIRPLQITEIVDGEAQFAVPSDFARTMVLNQTKPITDVLGEITGQTVTIKVIVDESMKADGYGSSIASITVVPDMPDTASRGALNQLPPAAGFAQGAPGNSPAGKSNLNPRYDFSTFVVGSNNRFAHSAALAVAGRPGVTYNPLFLYGGVGLGKTHIMQAIGNEILRHSPHLSVKYLSCERFTNDLIVALGEGRMLDFRKRYRQVDVLLVDDIQYLEKKETTQEEFFYTFNTLREAGKQIVLSSDRPPKALGLLEERLRSRFECGLTADVQAPELETRVAILRRKCELDNLPVDNEVLEYIASIFTSNIRELEGALIRTHAYASMTGTQLTLKELAQILRPAGPEKLKKTLTIDHIIDTVSQHFHVEPSDLRSAKRSQDLTLPRHVAMYLAHELIQMSFPRIGQAFGNRKHTSALYAYGRIKEQMLEDADLSRSINQISRQLVD
ncbi:MAG TPA: chromosomal replication initiator protein DnaA [Chroococcales cyanobacterium]